ncbi:hypothetical protein BofuT4_uP002200.1 [Botrytis cinerea T4]|uniref:Uncharacterized protein n=1 Tax=Botryotinia fuckeliana (strain T4) TaxID=999810 RepID=G2YMC5_BOTF4|nr:hypothetical protein BofuT4_uP002200.1 [Botrytis cinerea T4]
MVALELLQTKPPAIYFALFLKSSDVYPRVQTRKSATR